MSKWEELARTAGGSPSLQVWGLSLSSRHLCSIEAGQWQMLPMSSPSPRPCEGHAELLSRASSNGLPSQLQPHLTSPNTHNSIIYRKRHRPHPDFIWIECWWCCSLLFFFSLFSLSIIEWSISKSNASIDIKQLMWTSQLQEDKLDGALWPLELTLALDTALILIVKGELWSAGAEWLHSD